MGPETVRLLLLLNASVRFHGRSVSFHGLNGYCISSIPRHRRLLLQLFYIWCAVSSPLLLPIDIMVLMPSASLATIPPFFEPGAPPPTLPILIAQTEVGIVDTPSKLLAQEEIGSGPTVARSARSNAHHTPYPKSASKPSKTHQQEGSDRDTSHSELTSINDTDSESDDSHLISKPEGEAGRPGRGGYNLEEALKWEHKKYLKVKVSDFV